MVRYALVIVIAVACSKKAEPPPPQQRARPPEPVADAEVRSNAADAAIDAAAALPSGALGPIAELTLSYGTACARLADGRVACWGDMIDGVIGAGDAPSGCGAARCSRPVFVADVSDAAFLTMGMHFACVATAAGRVRCWGVGTAGQLGPRPPNMCTSTPFLNDTVRHACAMEPIEVAELDGVVSLSAGDQHVCAVQTDGSVVCWGDADLVDAKAESCDFDPATTRAQPCVPRPTKIAGITDAVEVSSGGGTSCVRTRSGSVKCWGNGRSGELGDGNPTPRWTKKPVTVVGLRDAVQLAAHSFGFCARRATGDIVCWGDDSRNKLGNGGDGAHRSTKILGIPRPTPVLVGGKPFGASDLWSASAVICAKRDDGTWCWGDVERKPQFEGLVADACPASRDDYCWKHGVVRTAGNDLRFIDSGMHACALLPAGYARCSSALAGGASYVLAPN